MGDKLLVVDFDGVLAEYNGWVGLDVFGGRMDYAKPCLDWLRKLGWKIAVHSTRKTTAAFLQWFEVWDIEVDAVNDPKFNPPDTYSKPAVAGNTVYWDDHSSMWDFADHFSWPMAFLMLVKTYHPDHMMDAFDVLREESLECGDEMPLSMIKHFVNNLGGMFHFQLKSRKKECQTT